MDRINNAETNPAGTFDRLVHYSLAAVGLVYGCGFLIVFTFFKSYGVDSADFVEAKYIHVGFLYLMACLVVGIPFWWVVWPMRSRFPGLYSKRIFRGMLLRTWKERLKYFRDDPLESFFFPEKWAADKTHGLHAGPGVVLSVILILWSFGSIVMFAPSAFGHLHAKLLVFNFLTPMAVLILGFLGDLFKIGKFSVSQNSYLQGIRHDLRVWWSIGGLIYLLFFLTVRYFRNDPLPLVFYFCPPIIYIVRAFFKLFNVNQGGKCEDARTRVAACQWALYSLQWAIVILQIWVFIWTITPHNLGVSLLDVLFGANYFSQLRTHWRSCDFPHGAIYFVFFILLISFFILRNAYRVKQIGLIRDRSHQLAASLSVAAIVIPLSYISVLSFAHTIYPYVPYEKGGGDYSESYPAQITFTTNAVTQTALSIPHELISENQSNCLIVLDENSSFVFLAATNGYAGVPANWRYGVAKPKVYEIRRDAIMCISQGK